MKEENAKSEYTKDLTAFYLVLLGQNKDLEAKGEHITQNEVSKLNCVQMLVLLKHIINQVFGTILELNVISIDLADFVEILRHF